MPTMTRYTVDSAEHLAYSNPGCTIVLRDIPEQWVPAKYRRLREWMHQMKFDNGSKITLSTRSPSNSSSPSCMAYQKYLKDYVKEAGGTLHLVLETIGSKQTHAQGWDFRNCSFKIPATGKVLTENIFESTFSYDLNGVEPMTHLEAYIKPVKGKEYVGFRVIKADAETSTGQTQTPYQQVTSERRATVAISDMENEQKVRQKQISLAGVYQARLSAGMETEKAREAAIADVMWLEKTATNLSLADSFAHDPS